MYIRNMKKKLKIMKLIQILFQYLYDLNNLKCKLKFNFQKITKGLLISNQAYIKENLNNIDLNV